MPFVGLAAETPWVCRASRCHASCTALDVFTRHRGQLAPEIVCFCDIPFDELGIHCTKYGRFGLAFDKSFMVGQGAASVMYLPLGGPIFTQLDEYVPATGKTNWQQAAKGPRAELLDGVVDFHNWLHYSETLLLDSVMQNASSTEEIDRVVKGPSHITV